MWVYHAQLLAQELKLLFAKCLSEYACNLIFGGHITSYKITRKEAFLHEIAIDLNMLSPLVEDWVFPNVKCSLIITVELHGLVQEDAHSS